MKLTALFMFGISLTAKSQITLSLDEAMEKRLITVVITGRQKTDDGTMISSHYGECLHMKVSNAGTKTVNVKLATGELLVPGDSAVQTMVVTKQNLLTLKAKETHEEFIYAMCTEYGERAPGQTISFIPGGTADARLYALALLIEKFSMHNAQGQNAVWAVTDGMNFTASPGDHAAAVLEQYIHATSEGQQVYYSGLVMLPESVRQAMFPESWYSYSFSGSFDFSIENTQNVGVFLCDENGFVMEEIKAPVSYSAGSHHLGYSFASSRLREGKVFRIVLTAGGKKIAESVLLY